MFDFIPLESYTAIYYSTLLVLVGGYAVGIQSPQGVLFIRNQRRLTEITVLFVFIVFYMGLRPISGVYFGDMATYALTFQRMNPAEYIVFREGDFVFNFYMRACSSIMDVHTWLLLTAIIYVGCLFWACKRIFPHYSWILFLACITAFSFWSYGTNGIRNGLATSLIVLGFSFYNRRWVAIALFALAIGIHKSVMLPIGAAVLAYFYTNTRHYMYAWVGCVFLSLLFGGFWENFFSELGLTDDTRLSGYLLNQEYQDQFSSTGFRFDFLLYSIIPIGMGGYTVLKKGKQDQFYLLLLNTYIIANAFWILVIRASFSNRFAYLSWFLYSLVLMYPALRFQLWKKQFVAIAVILFLHFLFTYIMWLRG